MILSTVEDAVSKPINESELLKQANFFAGEHFRTEKKQYSLITSLSVTSFPWKSLNVQDCLLRSLRKRPPHYEIPSDVQRNKSLSKHLKSTKYRFVKVRTQGRTIHEAAQKAFNAVNVLRGVLNFFVDEQVIQLFQRMKMPMNIAAWFSRTMLAWMKDHQAESRAKAAEMERQLDHLRRQQDRLLNLRLSDEIGLETYALKSTELRDRIASLKLQVDASDRGMDETAELAAKTFELSQRLEEKWFSANGSEKHQLLELLCLNLKLDGASLVFSMRKPFSLLVEGLDLQNNRVEETPIERFITESTTLNVALVKHIQAILQVKPKD